MPTNAEPRDPLIARAQSERFGIVVTTSMPRARVLASHADLVIMARIGTRSARALILALVAFGPLRSRDDPAAELARAIHNGELVPYYQPIVDLTTRAW